MKRKYISANITNKECLEILNSGKDLFAQVKYAGSNQRFDAVESFLKKRGFVASAIENGRFAYTVKFYKKGTKIETTPTLYCPQWDGILDY